MSENKFEHIHRVCVPELDAILGKPFNVLDKGFVRVVDYMGGDASIVQAARVSYGSGTKQVSEDAGLIRYLLRHSHTTPLEMCELKLHVKVPMDCWRQWIRHRTASVNEYSTRYSEAIDDKQETAPLEWRSQSTTNKQGSAEKLEIEIGKALTVAEKAFHQYAHTIYHDRLNVGVAREQARKDLPLSTYTEAYWKCDLHNLLHFLSLRMDSHAQMEIRSYANCIGDIVAKWVPLTWSAFNDYDMRRNALLLTAREIEIILLLRQHVRPSYYNLAVLELAMSFGWLDSNRKPAKNREREEFEVKAKRLGIILPWN